LLAQVAGAIEGEADLIQVREPDLGAAALTAFLRRLFREIPGSSARVVVNDRADVAQVTGAAGVHLTERSLELEDVRRLFSSDKRWVVGHSVHDADTAARSRSASYLLAGTVQTSGSKPSGWRLLGWTGLAAVVRAAEDTPVVAIGGLSAEAAPEVRRAGAAGIAGIECFLPEPGRDIAASVRERVCAVRHTLTL
jgi:thiamine-phosphate pyrophosphorylase